MTRPEPATDTPTPESIVESVEAGSASPTESPRNSPPRVRIKRQTPYALWFIWLIPVIAISVGLWLGVKSVLGKGPTITISFRSAEGLEAGKTKIRYKDVDIGLVKTIRLTPDHKEVEVTAELRRSDGIESLLVRDTRFWVVRPHVSAGGISGLGTLLSGAYIGLDIGRSSEPQRDFVGLEVPPIVTADLSGSRFVLKAENLGSLGISSPVYFRRVQVGQVVAFDLDARGKQVLFTIFVNAPYNRFVTQRARFWHASGVDVSLNAEGLSLRTESMASVLSGGGIAFQNMSESLHMVSPIAADNAEFVLHEDRSQALKQPDLNGYDYLLLFPSSVRGLSVGAPVDFRGLSIGEVTAVSIEDLPSAKNPRPKIAVTVRIYPSRLPTRGNARPAEGTPAAERAIMNPMVANGFRAQLRTGNLLTGQLYVTLDFFEKTAAAKIEWTHSPAIFPTVPGSFDSLQDSIASIADKLDRLPLDVLAKDLSETLKSVTQAVQHADTLVQQANKDIAPEAQKMLQDARKTLNDFSQTLSILEKSIGPEAPLQAQAIQALSELAKTAKSLRTMADYLERHPEALVRGKPEDPQ